MTTKSQTAIRPVESTAESFRALQKRFMSLSCQLQALGTAWAAPVTCLWKFSRRPFVLMRRQKRWPSFTAISIPLSPGSLNDGMTPAATPRRRCNHEQLASTEASSLAM